MNKMELNVILEKHVKWLNKEEDGEYADLRGADFTGANFTGAKNMDKALYEE